MQQSCTNCPRNCKNTFVCNKQEPYKINIYQLHKGEEPPISGTQGSGTIFFSCCNMKCVFCQNHTISQQGRGDIIDDVDLNRIFLELKNKNAHNINLVTPTPYSDKLIPFLKSIKDSGFDLPIIWNSSGYESLEIIKKLKGLVNIYLPDFKYSDNSLAIKYSSAPNYFETASQVIKEMRSQVTDVFSKEGIMKSGLIIRHLILPNHTQNSYAVLDAIKKIAGIKTHISLMAQYYPIYKSFEHPQLSRKLTKKEYDEIYNYFTDLEFENGFIQKLESASDEEIPEFK